MTIDIILPIAVSSIALLISAFTAYKTFIQKFGGQIWLGNYVVLNHVNNFPAITLACFFENSGAKLGILDDLRLVLEHRESGTSYKLYPLVMRDDYNIFETYGEKDWLAFSGIVLPPQSRVEKYVVFKPMIDHFDPQKGHLTLSVQRRWYGSDKWAKLLVNLPFELTENDIDQWKNQKKALLIATDNIQGLR